MLEKLVCLVSMGVLAGCGQPEPPAMAVMPAVPLSGGGTFHRLEGIRSGNFPSREAICTNFLYRESAGMIADVDGDGVNEVIITSPNFMIYRYDAAVHRLVPVITSPMSDHPVPAGLWFGDLDGDGNVDAFKADGVNYGQRGGKFDVAGWQRWPHDGRGNELHVKDQFTVADVDGDGFLDILSPPASCTDDARPIVILRQVAPRQFQDASDILPVVQHGINVQSIWVGEVAGERIIAAPGWGCGGGNLNVPHLFRERGGKWETVTEVGLDYGAPMGAVGWQGLLFVSYDPEHTAYQINPGRPWQKKELPWKIIPGPRGAMKDGVALAPMIPWGMQTIKIGDQEILLVAHGADSDGLCSTDGRRRGLEVVTAYTGSEARWYQVTGLGDLATAQGEWHWIATGELDGHLALVMGQVDADPAVFLYY